MRKTFVLLELLNHMVLVAQEAKARGHVVVALNRDPLRRTGPFAVPDGLVDELVPVTSWSDREEVAGLLKDVHERYDVVGTYAAFEATLPHEAALRTLAGLPNNGEANTRAVLDKAGVRDRLRGAGLSGLPSATLGEALAWQEWPDWGTAVVKPANGTGSSLCYRVSSLEALHRVAAEARAGAVVNPLMRDYILDHGEFVVEQEAAGELLSVESLVDRGRVHVLGLTGRYVLASDPVVEMGLQFPYHHPRAAEAAEKARAIHEALGIVHGPTQIEFMVPDTGPIELIDFNVRSAGTASVVSFGEAFGTRHEVVLCDIACGLDPDLSFLDRPTRHAVEMLLLPPHGTTHMVPVGFPAGTLCRRLSKPLGEPLSGRADQLDAVAMFVVSAETASQVHAAALEARRATLFDGVPLGDDPHNVLQYSAHLAQDLTGGAV
ncbi:acetyl-CoA carboxylase biotin carboxylase subunit family protein [Streptomyces sp. NPDC088757]|uniref:ATP-grasp domain-containing protein n=1 Tax=Streptomyces sp. NPDC088757 TaxID=3365889 RepID=UPI00382294EF